jgi:hypothetical protein
MTYLRPVHGAACGWTGGSYRRFKTSSCDAAVSTAPLRLEKHILCILCVLVDVNCCCLLRAPQEVECPNLAERPATLWQWRFRE